MFLILFYAIFYFILAKIRLNWAIMFLVAALPSYLIRFQILGIPFTLLELMILISFIIWLIFHTEFKNFLKGQYGWKQFKENRKFRIKYPFSAEIILLLLISYIAVAISGFNNNALGIWKAYFFEPILVYILILNLFWNKPINYELQIINMLSISAFIISIIAIYQKFTGIFIFNELWAAEETRRITSVFEYPNAVGLYLGPIILLMTGRLRQIIANCQLLKTIFISITIFLSMLAIYFAKSEGAIIGVATGLVVFGLLADKKIKLATILLIFIIGIGIISHQPFQDYVIKKITLTDLSGEIRKQQWRETLKMLTDSKINFLFGVGLANYQQKIKPYHQDGIFFNKNNDPDFRRKLILFDEKYKKQHWQPVEIYLYPHNIFLNFWVELGLFGMLLFVWIIIKQFYQLSIINYQLSIKKTNNQYVVIGLMCAMVVIIIHGLVDVPYFKNDLAIMFWILLAIFSCNALRVIDKTL